MERGLNRVLASRTRWVIPAVEYEEAERLADLCGIHPLVARLLLVRGYETPEQIRAFLQEDGGSRHDPYLLDGMREAVETIRRALQEEKHIRIYGDYDADGITSTALMTWLMRELGAKFDTYIPHRVHEGYGLHREALDKAKQDGVDLIITVDTGISAYEEAQYAEALGIELVITDHHEPPERLPQAAAVINPKKPNCSYPFKQLAGVGVALKLAQALMGEVPVRFIELAAVGTIADLMPLIDENRAIVREGLAAMQRSSSAGLRALFQVAGLEGREISAGHIGFAIGPRINASGRLTSADIALNLLITEDEQEAYELAKELDELNRDRQRIVDETLEEALQMLMDRYGDEANLPPVIIAAADHWNAGVIGIVAARLLERFYRPTLVFTSDPETGLAKGSARSIHGFDIYRALTECADLLDHFGGHQAAAGMTLSAERLEELQERLNTLASEQLTEEDYIPLTEVDLRCGLADCTIELIEQLERLAPFGIGNRSPKLLIPQATVKEMRKIGKEGQHLKLLLSDQTGLVLDAVGFGYGHLQAHIAAQAKADVVGELQVNEWNGMRKPQLLIHDIRVNHLQVFDWRGLKPTLQAAAAGVRHMPGLREQAAFVICDRSPYWTQVIEAMFGKQRILLLQDDGNLSPLHSDPSPQPYTDLVLVQLPHSSETWKRMLRMYGSQLERLCIWLADAELWAAGCPPRERFKHVYAHLRQQRTWPAADAGWLRIISQRTGLADADVAWIIRVFEELEFVVREGDRMNHVPKPVPRDLSESKLFTMRKRGQPLAESILLMSTQQLTETIYEMIQSAVSQAG